MQSTTINVDADKLLPVKLALSRLPRRPSPATLWRWRVKGVNGVKLECVRSGGQWLTSAGAVSAFLKAQTAACSAPPPDSAGTPKRTLATTRRLIESGLVVVRAE